MRWGRRKRLRLRSSRLKPTTSESLKANHPTWFQQVEGWLQTARAKGTLPMPSAHTTEAGHHRTESRKVWTLSLSQLPPLYQADEWVGLLADCGRRTNPLSMESNHSRAFSFTVLCLPADSPRIAAAIRQHWGIENSLLLDA